MTKCLAPINEKYKGRFVVCSKEHGHKGAHEYVPLKFQNIIVPKGFEAVKDEAETLRDKLRSITLLEKEWEGKVKTDCALCGKFYKLNELTLSYGTSSYFDLFITCPNGHITKLDEKPELDEYIDGFGKLQFIDDNTGL